MRVNTECVFECCCSHDDLDALDPMANLPHSGMIDLCLVRQPYLVSTVFC